MSLLISIPQSMQPSSLCSELLSLDPNLEIIEGHANVKNSKNVEFAVVWSSFPEGFFLNYPNLKAICTYGHGADLLLRDKQLPKEVPIVRLKDSTMAASMSEYLLAVVLLNKRQLLNHSTNHDFVEWGISSRKKGNHVSILGLGYLGQAAAKTFLKMGFEVSGWSRTQKEFENIRSFSGKGGLNKMLQNSDYLINLLPLTQETSDLLDRITLSKLKRGAYFINVGRGKTLVENDLIHLLETGHLSGACLDVFRKEPLPKEHPFRNHKKIIITPHNSSSTPATSVAPQILENYRRAISGRTLLNLVDLTHGY